MRRDHFLLGGTGALLLAGCAGVTGPGRPSPGRAPTLADEHRRLRSELAGTPVEVDLLAGERLRVEVPLRFCFDAGRSAVKPPLAAVLDRMASGLKRQSTELRVLAPSDPSGSALLASDRAASTRDYLVGKGVAVGRFASVGRGSGDGVEIVVSERAR